MQLCLHATALAGTRRALERLARTGFVDRLGSGRSQQFQLRDSDPLTTELRNLFRVELERYQSVISHLRSLFQSFKEIQIAWIDERPTEAGQPLHIGALADARSLPYLNDQVRHRLNGVEGEFDITIEVHLFSRADIPDVAWHHATILAVLTPEEREEL